jgi:small-conductance mechanosensitive channel
MALGPTLSFWELVALWVVRVVLITLICFFLGWLGIRALDALTPKIHERVMIGKNPTSVGLFIAGFFIYVGLVVHGVAGMPTVGIGSLIDFRRLGMIAVAFAVSLLVGIGILNLVDRLTPQIPFRGIQRNSIATGVYVFGYLVFLGLITNAALTTPI